MLNQISIDNHCTLKKAGLSLSHNQKKYLNSLYKIISDIDFDDRKKTIARIINIENNIENDSNLTEKEKIILFSSTQTAKYSFNYCAINANKWKDLKTKKVNSNLRQFKLNMRTSGEEGRNPCSTHKQVYCQTCAKHLDGDCRLPQKDCSICQAHSNEQSKDVIKADIDGAVLAGATIWWANTVPGGGQLTYGSAMVGAAVTSSTWAAVKNLIRW